MDAFGSRHLPTAAVFSERRNPLRDCSRAQLGGLYHQAGCKLDAGAMNFPVQFLDIDDEPTEQFSFDISDDQSGLTLQQLLGCGETRNSRSNYNDVVSTFGHSLFLALLTIFHLIALKLGPEAGNGSTLIQSSRRIISHSEPESSHLLLSEYHIAQGPPLNAL